MSLLHCLLLTLLFFNLPALVQSSWIDGSRSSKNTNHLQNFTGLLNRLNRRESIKKLKFPLIWDIFIGVIKCYLFTMLISRKVSVLLLLLLLFVVVVFPFYGLELAMQLWCCFDIALLTDLTFVKDLIISYTSVMKW